MGIQCLTFDDHCATERTYVRPYRSRSQCESLKRVVCCGIVNTHTDWTQRHGHIVLEACEWRNVYECISHFCFCFRAISYFHTFNSIRSYSFAPSGFRWCTLHTHTSSYVVCNMFTSVSSQRTQKKLNNNCCCYCCYLFMHLPFSTLNCRVSVCWCCSGIIPVFLISVETISIRCRRTQCYMLQTRTLNNGHRSTQTTSTTKEK